MSAELIGLEAEQIGEKTLPLPHRVPSVADVQVLGDSRKKILQRLRYSFKCIHLAEDAYQEVTMRVLEGRTSFDATTMKADAWLFFATRNQMLTMLRANKAVQFGVTDSGVDASEMLMDPTIAPDESEEEFQETVREALELLPNAILSLPDQEREILQSVLSASSQREVANVMGVKEYVISRRMASARHHLYEILAHYLHLAA